MVEADPRLLSVAVRILIENACVHAGGKDLRVSVTEHSVEVCDRGPGFPKEVLEINRQGLEPVSSTRGTGLGLAIAGLVAQLHGGELALANRAGGGARAFFRIGPGHFSSGSGREPRMNP